jgi:MFS family permease
LIENREKKWYRNSVSLITKKIFCQEISPKMALAMIQIGQNSGVLLRALVFGWVVESWGGWPTAFWILAPVSVSGAIAGWMAKIR